MGEEEKKPEEVKKPEEPKPKPEEKKPEEKSEKKEEPPKGEEKKTEEQPKEAPPPPPDDKIVLKVFMHCEGCARKVKRCLKGFQGVEDVETDCKTHKVVVKGKTADPVKVCERVQKKSHRKVELISPIPKPPEEDAKKADEPPKEEAKPEEKKEEPKVITVLLKVHMHCEACALEIQKRIMRMKGVESAEPDLKGSQVTVKGVFDPPKLVEYVYKRTGKQATIVKTEPEKKEEEKDEKKAEAKEKTEEGEKKEKKEGEEGKEAAGEEGKDKVELVKHEYYYYPPKYAMEYAAAYPPQIFSDENPNACSVM